MAKKVSPKVQAFRDIHKTFENNIMDENCDVWVVTGNLMDNKKERKLNKELGINKVNYGNTNKKEI